MEEMSKYNACQNQSDSNMKFTCEVGSYTISFMDFHIPESKEYEN